MSHCISNKRKGKDRSGADMKIKLRTMESEEKDL